MVGSFLSWDRKGIEDSVVVFNKVDKKYYLFYSGGPPGKMSIGVANSIRPLGPFKKILDNPIIPAVKNTWKHQVRIGSVVRVENEWFLYFWGADSSRIAKIGLMKSTDLINWAYHTEEPIVVPESKLGEDTINHFDVSREGNQFVAAYNKGINKDSSGICLAYSKNGIDWYRMKNNPIITPKIGTFYSNEVSHPRIVKIKDTYNIFFEAGDDNNTWRIEQATTKDIFHESPTTIPNPVLDLGASGTWDSKHVANPYLFRYRDYWILFYSGHNGKKWYGIGAAVSSVL